MRTLTVELHLPPKDSQIRHDWTPMELSDLPEHLRARVAAQIGAQNARAPKKKPIPGAPTGTLLEEDFIAILRVHAPDLLPPEKQFKYSEGRRFSADFCYPAQRLLIELEGGVLDRVGGHSSVKGLLNDIDRSQECAGNGWRVFRASRDDVTNKPAQMMDRLRRAVEWKPEISA